MLAILYYCTFAMLVNAQWQKYYYKWQGDHFDILYSDKNNNNWKEVKAPKMYKKSRMDRGDRPGICTKGEFTCSHPYPRTETYQFECVEDYQCPRPFKCCRNNCFLHKICQLPIKDTAGSYTTTIKSTVSEEVPAKLNKMTTSLNVDVTSEIVFTLTEISTTTEESTDTEKTSANEERTNKEVSSTKEETTSTEETTTHEITISVNSSTASIAEVTTIEITTEVIPNSYSDFTNEYTNTSKENHISSNTERPQSTTEVRKTTIDVTTDIIRTAYPDITNEYSTEKNTISADTESPQSSTDVKITASTASVAEETTIEVTTEIIKTSYSDISSEYASVDTKITSDTKSSQSTTVPTSGYEEYGGREDNDYDNGNENNDDDEDYNFRGSGDHNFNDDRDEENRLVNERQKAESTNNDFEIDGIDEINNAVDIKEKEINSETFNLEPDKFVYNNKAIENKDTKKAETANPSRKQKKKKSPISNINQKEVEAV